ncbi:MAG: ATP synthase F0 subunit B [Myxococcales bacterium]|nr:ATP synthase F0 subunit B [Myxococcales bacterium]MCB9546510.1 ATP synthase F0 subunit B [Myxococcales bacterium]
MEILSAMDSLQISLTPMGGDVNIDIDLSLFVQLGVFLVVFILLTRLVFRPFLASIDARDKKTVAARDEAHALDARASELEQRHREGISQARNEAAADRQVLRVEGLSAKEAEVREARTSAEAVVEAARTRAAAQYEAGRTQLLGEVDAISRMVVEKIIGRGV